MHILILKENRKHELKTESFVSVLVKCVKQAFSGLFESIMKEVVTRSQVGSVRGSQAVLLPFLLFLGLQEQFISLGKVPHKKAKVNDN